MTNKLLNLRFSNIVVLILCLVFLLAPINAIALTQDELQRQKQYQEQLAKQAREQAAQKQQEAQMVQKQISNLENQINRTQNSIVQTNNEITNTENKIEGLENDIKTKEENLAQEKDKLGKVVTSWYMEGESGLFEAVLSSNSLSEVTTKQQYYESIKQQISGMIDQINNQKDELKKQKQEQETQKASMETLKNDQIERQKSLEYNKSYKNQLLNYTKDTITDLKKEEADAQERIKQIDSQIRALSATKRWGDQIVSSNDSSWYYTQTGNQTRLGDSPYTVSQYGCLITSIAMVGTFYGTKVTPSDIASDPGNFDRQGYLMVSSPAGTGVNIEYSKPVDWNVVDDEISNGRPIIVSLYMPEVGKINRDGSSHFIVIKGKSGNKYLMHDPLGDGRGYNISQVRSMKIVRSQ